MSVGALLFVAVLAVLAAFAINGPTPEAVKHLTILVFLGPPIIYTVLYAPAAAVTAKALLKDERATWNTLLISLYPSGFLGVALAEIVAALLTYIVVVEHASRQAVIAQLLVVTVLWGVLSAYIGARLAWTKYSRLAPAAAEIEPPAPASEPPAETEITVKAVAQVSEAEVTGKADPEPLPTAGKPKQKTARKSRGAQQSGRRHQAQGRRSGTTQDDQ